MRIFLVAALIVAFLAIVFALQNAYAIAITFGVWRVTASLALILLITLGLGLITGLLVSTPAVIRRNLKIAKYKRQISELQQDLDDVNRELSHQQQLLAQAHEDITEQQTRLDRQLPSTPQPSSAQIVEPLPQKQLPEPTDIETAELIEDSEDWI
ncbi:MAG: lipopolysaccharide assembly protein LapA domain-containing protein [Cyanobacteria bacterium P01_F01_bin.150]